MGSVINAVRNENFESCFESGVTGLVGTVSWQLVDNTGAITYSPSTADIIETPASSGIYCTTKVAPLVIGTYSIIWSIDGTFDASSTSIDDLVVHSSAADIDFGPLLPVDVPAPTVGPCNAWTTVEDVAACCDVVVGSSVDLFEDAAIAATQVLYALSARKFNPGCERVVRPLQGDWPCGVQVLSRGHVVNWDGFRWSDGLSRALLPNYPVTEIIEVKVDGDILAENEYRLDGWRWLTRRASANGDANAWPDWQRRDRVDTEDLTFSVRYLFGQNPPAIGSMAAAQLACEIYKSCSNNEGVAECKIPKNATRVTRSGVTIEMGALRYDTGLRSGQKGWKTGMSYVDLFLNAENPNGLVRRPAIWSPDAPRMAEELGTALGS